MKVGVFGAWGYIGHELFRALSDEFREVVDVYRKLPIGPTFFWLYSHALILTSKCQSKLLCTA